LKQKQIGVIPWIWTNTKWGGGVRAAVGRGNAMRFPLPRVDLFLLNLILSLPVRSGLCDLRRSLLLERHQDNFLLSQAILDIFFVLTYIPHNALWGNRDKDARSANTAKKQFLVYV